MKAAGCWAIVFLITTIFAGLCPAAGKRVLLDTDLDGWSLWTAYGPRMNETYGAGNNSKHHHHPSRVLTNRTARVLEAVDMGEGQPKRYQSGCLSTREAPNGSGFFRFADDIRSLRFEFDVTISDWNHAVWPACWLRGIGGASVHEIDVLEGFTAQTGTDRYRVAVHSAGNINVIRDPWPGTPLAAGERATVWAEVHRPGTLHATDAFIRAGKGNLVTVNQRDPHTADWWADDYGWDLIVQQQIGGNWVGDPDLPYTGFLQNGQPGRPAEEVLSWDGYSTMTVHRVRVVAAVDAFMIENVLLNAGIIEIHFNSWVARDYTLETTTDLARGEWSPVSGQGPRPGTGGPDIMYGPMEAPLKFFRVAAFEPAYPAQPRPGRLYWGSSYGGNADPTERHEIPAGAPLSLRRTFFRWDQRDAAWMKGIIAADHENRRLPWVSFKTPPWREMASGKHDAAIDLLLTTLNQAGPVWLTMWHEPENNTDQQGSPADHLAMNRQVRQRMDALGIDQIALAPVLMAWTWDDRSGRNPDHWWEPGVYDFLGIDIYRRSESSLLTETWYDIRAWAQERGVDVAVGEWGMWGDDAAAGERVREWYDHAAESYSDGRGSRVVGLAAFDSHLNSSGGWPADAPSWNLRGEQLRVFHELMADPRTTHIPAPEVRQR